MAQVDSWAEVEASLVAVEKAIDKIPAPPVPHDGFGMKVNQLKKAAEGTRETAMSMRQQEDEL